MTTQEQMSLQVEAAMNEATTIPSMHYVIDESELGSVAGGEQASDAPPAYSAQNGIDDLGGHNNVEPFDSPAPATEERKDVDDDEEKRDLDEENPIGPVIYECLDKAGGIPEKVQPEDGDRMDFDDEWRYNISIGDVVKRTVRVPNPKKKGEFMDETLWFPKEKADRKVFVALKVKRVSDVSNVNETFNMRFHIYFNWIITPEDYIKYMTVKASGDSRQLMEWEPTWFPHIEIQNIVDQSEFKWEVYPEEGAFRVQKFKDFGKKKDAEVPEHLFDSAHCRFIRAKLEVEGVFAEELELQSFPFDCQDLSCAIHERSSNVKCVFVPELRKPNFASIDPRYSVIDEWDLDTAIIEMGDAEGSRTKSAYSMIVIRLKMKRRFMVYIWSIVFLVACITFLALTAFALPENDLGPRLGLVITLILTAVAFSYVAFENLPNVPYLTLMDKYILSGYAYLVGVMIESAFLQPLGASGDRTFFWIFFIVFWVGHLFFGIYSYILRVDELNKLNFSSDEIDEEVAAQRPKIRFDYRKRQRAGNGDRLLSFTGTVDVEGMSAQAREKSAKHNAKLEQIAMAKHEAKRSNMSNELPSKNGELVPNTSTDVRTS